MKFILTIIFLFTGTALSAQQNAVIRGTIADAQSNQPLENVTVKIAGTKKATLTNEEGVFEFTNLKPGTYILIFSFVGYTGLEQRVTVTDTIIPVEIKMVSSSKELSAVTVTGMSDEQAEARKIKQNVMPVSIITAKQIENRAGNLNEILARQAGIVIRQNGGLGNSSTINIRGLEGKRVAIFIDGNPLNTPDGSLGINDLPVQIIERIEIYKGAVPAWLGGDGLGSAVNVVLRHRDISYIDASISKESYNTTKLGAIIKKTWDKQGIEAGAGVFNTTTDNNYIMELPFQKGTFVTRNHDYYRSTLAGLAVRFHKLWFDEIEVEGAMVNNRKQIQGLINNIQHIESRSNAGLVSLNLVKSKLLQGKMRVNFNSIFVNFKSKFIDTSSLNYNWDGTKFPSNTIKGELGNGPNDNTTRQKELRLRLNLNYVLTPNWTFNFNNTSRLANFNPNDTLGNRFAGGNVFNYPGSLANSITGFTVEHRKNNDKLLLSAAIKHYYNYAKGFNTSIYNTGSFNPDKVNNKTNNAGYNVGVRYNINNYLFIKASHERGVRLPNNAELFGDGILITPAVFLKPELSYNNNLGLIYDKTNNSNGNRLQAEVSTFFMLVQDLIQLRGNGLTLGYTNYAKARIIGLEAEVKYDITKNIFASVNATWQQVKDNQKISPGTQNVPNPTYNLNIPNVPRCFGNWSIEYHSHKLLKGENKTRLIYDGSFNTQFDYGFNISVYDEFFIPSYLSHTLSVEQTLFKGKFILSAEANNITDAVIINNFNNPLVGRTFRIKARILLLGKAIKENHTH